MTRRITLMLVAMTLCIASTLLAPRAQASLRSLDEEHWTGSITLPGMTLTINVHFAPDENAPGVWTAKLDIPAQGVTGADMSDVTRTDEELTFTFKQVGAVFAATINADGETATGSLQQAGMTFPLELERRTAEQMLAAQPKRPQMPKPPFPYAEREVEYQNEIDGITIAGTLTIPAGDGPFPAVVMITGSGPQDRDESLAGHKPFLVIADYLSRRGIAVLRSDDRGIGGTGGSTPASTSKNFALDALAGVAFLKTIDRVDPTRIGLMGHSEGGIVGPMAAAQSADVAFVVMLAGTGLPGAEILRLQTRLLLDATGAFSEEQLDEMTAKHRAFTETVENDAPREAQMNAIIELMRAQGMQLEDAALQRAASQQLTQMNSPWMRFFLTHDPRPDLRNVTCPVLAINGSLDLQVPADVNLAEIEKALAEAGNKDVTTRKLENLNHLFQHATTGSPAEYALIEETFSTEALDLIAKWINTRFGVTGEASEDPITIH